MKINLEPFGTRWRKPPGPLLTRRQHTALANSRRRQFSRARGLTRWGARELNRRSALLQTFDALCANGLSRAAAAAELHLSCATLWRWKRRLAPRTHFSGRPSALELLSIPDKVLDSVRRLQLSGCGNAKAWRLMAERLDCPANLAAFLRGARTIPPSFLRATRLVRRSVRLVEGPDVLLICKLKTT